MTLKPTMAALGPAFLLALATQPLKLTELLPSPLLVFAVALMASVVTLLINARSFHRNSSTNRTTSTSTAATGKPASNTAGKPDARTDSKKETGSVKWFNASKGFGFITRANGDEIFVHFRSIVGQRSLRDGQKVEFAVISGSKGLQAEDVIALK